MLFGFRCQRTSSKHLDRFGMTRFVRNGMPEIGVSACNFAMPVMLSVLPFRANFTREHSDTHSIRYLKLSE